MATKSKDYKGSHYGGECYYHDCPNIAKWYFYTLIGELKRYYCEEHATRINKLNGIQTNGHYPCVPYDFSSNLKFTQKEKQVKK